ncbi:MAG: RluA family pseudouridine synthase [Kiritimatiellae bacterium]|nr:RluA family pseudouridine synthase [Kiritimatiellia bacterium]
MTYNSPREKPGLNKRMTMPSPLVVSAGEGGMTLLAFLVARLQISGRKAKRLLDGRHVFVNRRRTWIAHHSLRSGDVVELAMAPALHPDRNAPTVLVDDPSFLIVDKPPGLVCTGPGSLEAILRSRLAIPDLAAVHRLDRDTSGCLILAKSMSAAEYFSKVFRERRVRKLYHAIVVGRLHEDSFSITSPIDGEPAVTHVRTLDTNREASHVLVRIETGRTHQIRRHLAARRHPVLGDRQYLADVAVTDRMVQVPRQMLHSYRLTFLHPGTGKPFSVTAPLPADFRACLRLFRLT